MSTGPGLATKPYVVSAEGTVAPEPREGSGWVTFAGIMFLVSAFANFFWGLAALDTRSYLAEDGLLYSTLETWGWVALGWSALVLIGGILVLTRTSGSGDRRGAGDGQLHLLAVRAARDAVVRLDRHHDRHVRDLRPRGLRHGERRNALTHPTTGGLAEGQPSCSFDPGAHIPGVTPMVEVCRC
jgi:hypothetical protein